MQKKRNSFYTFNLQNFFKTKNKINRVELSGNLFHTIAIISTLIAVIALACFVGFVKNTAFAKSNEQIPVQIESNQPARPIQKAEYKTISYDRPAESDIDVSYDNGDAPTELSNTPGAENNQLETQIETIIKTSSPAFLPTLWAHFGKINNEFGYRRNPFGGGSYEFHPGLDIDGEMGDTVIAPANGIVVKAERMGGYGNMIEIDHGNGLTTRYGHLSRIEAAVGSAVQRGQLIGLVGSTGRSTGAHLHFEVRLNDKPINPRRFLSTATTEIAQLHVR